MLILLLLSDTISGLARGSGPPRAALLGGGGKIEVILKNSVRGKEFLGGLQKSHIWTKNREAPKKDVKKILGYDTKISRGGKFKDHPGRQTP